VLCCVVLAMSGAGAAGARADADSSGAASSSRARLMLGIRWGSVDHIPRVQLDADITADTSPYAVRAAFQKQRGVSCLPVGEPTSLCTSHTQPALVVDGSGNMVPYLGGFPLVYALSNDTWVGEAGELSTARFEAFFECIASCIGMHFEEEEVPPRDPRKTLLTLNEMLSYSAWAASSNKPSNTAPVVIRCQSDVDLPDGLRWLPASNVGRFWGMRLLQPTRSMAVAEFMAAVDSVCTVRPRYQRRCSPYPRLPSFSTMPRDALHERYGFGQALVLATKVLVVEHRLCDALRTFALLVTCDCSPHEFVRCWREECPATDAGTMARAFTLLQTRYLWVLDPLRPEMKPWDRIKDTIHRHHGDRYGKLPTHDIIELGMMWETGKAEDVGRTDGCGCDTLAPPSAAKHHTATDASKLPAEASGAAPTEAPALTRHGTLCRKCAGVARPRAQPTIALHLCCPQPCLL